MEDPAKAQNSKPRPFDKGRYLLLELVGRGGSGEVWRARQAELDRVVAIKVLASDLDSDDTENQLLRLKDEAMAASKVRHHGLVEVIDAGHDKELGPYVVYEYLDGGTLEEWLKNKGPLTPKLVHEKFGATMLDALHTLHKAGIVHRDIKPENLVANSDGVFKLTDLGLANFHGRSVRTKTGMFWGTPGYMAPERFTAPPPKANAKQDVYAAAMMYVRAISGKMPFQGKTVGAIVREQIDRDISLSELKKLNIPYALAEVLARGIHRSADKRITDAATLKKEISKALSAPKTKGVAKTRVATSPNTLRVEPYEKPKRSAIPLFVILFVVSSIIAYFLSTFREPKLSKEQLEVRLQRHAKEVLASDNQLTDSQLTKIGQLHQRLSERSQDSAKVEGLLYLALFAAGRDSPQKACNLFEELGDALVASKETIRDIVDNWLPMACKANREEELLRFCEKLTDFENIHSAANSVLQFSLNSVQKGRKDSGIEKRCLAAASWLVPLTEAKCTDDQAASHRKLLIDCFSLPGGDECKLQFHKWLQQQTALTLRDENAQRLLYLQAARATSLAFTPTIKEQQIALNFCIEAEKLCTNDIDRCEVLFHRTIVDLVIRPGELTTCREQAEKAQVTLKRAAALAVPRQWKNLIISVKAMAAIAGPEFSPKRATKFLGKMQNNDVPQKWEWWYWRVRGALARATQKRKTAIKLYEKTQSMTPPTAMFYMVTRKQNTILMSLPGSMFK